MSRIFNSDTTAKNCITNSITYLDFKKCMLPTRQVGVKIPAPSATPEAPMDVYPGFTKEESDAINAVGGGFVVEATPVRVKTKFNRSR